MIYLLKSLIREWWWLIRFFGILFIGYIISYVAIVLPFNPNLLFAKSVEQYSNQYRTSVALPFLIHLSGLAGSLLAYGYVEKIIEGKSWRRFLKLDISKLAWGSNIGLVIMMTGMLILLIFGLISLSFTSILTLPKLIVIFAMVAISEEVVFRGYILRNMIERFSENFSIVFSALLFSGLHVFNSHFGLIAFINIFLGGVLLAIVYLRSNDLSVPIGLHFSWNLVQAIFGFAVSGQQDTGVFSINYLDANELLTGGAFGLEGSIMLIPVILVAILLFARKEFLKPSN